MHTLIVVPARYGSTRFPGKPLTKINGISMVRRTAQIAANATKQIKNCDTVVATDDARIAKHCEMHGIAYVMTNETLKTGSDRALATADILAAKTGKTYTYVINLQGDAPFTSVSSIVALAETIKTGADVATPYIQLTWDGLDALRKHKVENPFSGTTVIVGPDGHAIWFSKNIIPAIRNENSLRASEALCLINRHIGLYAYSYDALKRFTSSPDSHYEKLEGLEQLRILENGMNIACVRVEPPAVTMSGIDTPADLELAENLIAKHGDPFQ